MSLEAAIAELTTTMKELISETKELRSMRSEAIDKVAGALSNVSGTKAKETKPAKEETKAKADPKPEPETKEDTVSYEGLKELVAKYVTGTDREEERTARKEKVKALLNHEKIKKPDAPDTKSLECIMESAIPLFRSQMEKLIEKGDITSPPTSSDDLDL